jgi:predicted dehydrogenase
MKRIAVCGVSGRAIHMFVGNVCKLFGGVAEIVALLDIDPVRFDVCKTLVPELNKDVPCYMPEDFDKMVAETKPNIIMTAGRDITHVDYIIKGLEKDLDVITEKPMVTTSEDCLRVLEAEKKSKGSVTVTFNYRYAPPHQKIRELVATGRVGKVISVDLNWYIDTYHGASYFQRWNRMRENSGGLSIHKCTHHFDLVNWWINQSPVEVFAYSAMNFFGKDGEKNPEKGVDGRKCSTCKVSDKCIYYSRWNSRSSGKGPEDDHLGKGVMGEGKPDYTDYTRDSCIFDSEINIEDTYAAVIKYDGGAFLNYSANFSTPYEGYHLAINGTEGRVESVEMGGRTPWPVPEQQYVDFMPLFGSRERIDVVNKGGGHGGGDPLMLEDIFLGKDPLRGFDVLAASIDGVKSVVTGEAVWKSGKEHRPIELKELTGFEFKDFSY